MDVREIYTFLVLSEKLWSIKLFKLVAVDSKWLPDAITELKKEEVSYVHQCDIKRKKSITVHRTKEYYYIESLYVSISR